MIGTVRARANHYEVLGLKATASNEEIAQAFAREITGFRPRAFGGLVDVSVAYETLRDPIKRRTYDASIGVKAEPPPYFAVTARWGGKPVISAAPARPIHDRLPPTPTPTPTLAPAPTPTSTPPALAQAKPELPAEPKAAPFIAASPLLDPVAPQSEPPPAPEARLERREDWKISQDQWVRHARELPLGDAEDSSEWGPVAWRRTAILVGAPVAVVVLIGALAGWQAGRGEDQPQAVTTALPPAKPRPVAVSPAPEVERSVAEAQAYRPPRVAAVRIKRSPVPPTPSPAEDPLAAEPEASQIAEAAADPGAEPAAIASTPAAETAAAMPLPRAVIARTIERIGYACGQVASTSAVEGARGVYTVTCTSGASYQAKPVRGRYHFRRVGNH